MTSPRLTDDELLNLFTHHPPPTPDAVETYQAIREAGRVFATVIRDLCPAGEDTNEAIKHVRAAVWTSNAAIACDTDLSGGAAQPLKT